MMFDDEKGLYAISMVAQIINEHPETLRVWEKNELLKPERCGMQRRYSNNDILRLKFIKYLIDEKGLNVAGTKQLISMYSCWNKRNCKGGASRNACVSINESKPCWKGEGTFCLMPSDKAEMCSSCIMLKNCVNCKGCQ